MLVAYPGGYSPVLEQQGVEGGLVGVVEIRFTLPRVSGRVVFHVGFPPPRAVRMTDDVFVCVGPEDAAGAPVALLTGGAEQPRGRPDALRGLLEEPLRDYQFPVPIDSVAETTVTCPCVLEYTIKEVPGGIQ